MIKDPFSSLQEYFLSTDEGAADGRIGTEINHENEKMTLKQPQLIERIIELLGAKDTYHKATPVFKLLLNKNTDGK